MWENETVVLVSSLKKRILGGNERVRYSRIDSDEAVPAFIKEIFQGRVHTYLTDETPVTIQATPHFDLQSDDIQKLQNQIIQAVRENAIFHETDVENILGEALILRLNYLLKPIDTLRRLLFENRKKITLVEMESSLASFRKILPYADALLERCKHLEKSEISGDEYTQLADEILDAEMSLDPVRTSLRDYSVLTEFLSETKGEEVAQVEGEFIEKFFADRNAWDFRRAIDVERKLGKEDFSASDLEITLRRYLQFKQEFGDDKLTDTSTVKASPAPVSNPVAYPEPEALETLEDVLAQPSVEEPVLEDESLDTTFPVDEVVGEDALFVEEKEAEIPAEPEPAVEVSKPISEPTQQMKIIRKEPKEEIAPEPDPIPLTMEKDRDRTIAFRDLIDGKAEKTFIKKLFGGDRSAYQDLTNRLEEAESWRVAKILIDNELFKRDVDPFSREAIKLVDLVYSLFYPEEGVGG